MGRSYLPVIEKELPTLLVSPVQKPTTGAATAPVTDLKKLKVPGELFQKSVGCPGDTAVAQLQLDHETLNVVINCTKMGANSWQHP